MPETKIAKRDRDSGMLVDRLDNESIGRCQRVPKQTNLSAKGRFSWRKTERSEESRANV